MSRRPLRALVFLVAAFAVAQLLSLGLDALRPPSPPVLFDRPESLVDPRAPADGPANADVTIILFSDYACPACRAQHPGVRQVIAADGHLRIVYRDWPIFGPASTRAARLAIASARQGKHTAFDDLLMRGRIDDAGLRAAAAKAGLDWARLEADAAAPTITALLADTERLARAQFPGTPVMVIGPYLVAGRMSAERLDALISRARAANQIQLQTD
jgi:protein-disulfide isomerase